MAVTPVDSDQCTSADNLTCYNYKTPNFIMDGNCFFKHYFCTYPDVCYGMQLKMNYDLPYGVKPDVEACHESIVIMQMSLAS